MDAPLSIPRIPLQDRAAIARENAQKSTGPRTESGKNRVRLNALKHGALSSTVVLPYEDQAAYDELGLKLTAQYAPATQEERDGLAAIQATHWRLDRILSLESNLYAVGIREELQSAQNFFPNLDRDGHIGIARARAYRQNARTFDQLHRQETRLRRLLDKQVEAFIDLQASQPEPEPNPKPGAQPEHVPHPEAAPSAAGRFVSQTIFEPTVTPRPSALKAVKAKPAKRAMPANAS